MPVALDSDDLIIVRRAYARQMLAVGGVTSDPRLEDAFAAVPRERFLGPPPWQMRTFEGHYRALPFADPVLAYQDVLFALAPDRGVNNGSPALHARWLHHLAPRSGATAVHIGAGTGYYTALLAELTGPRGRVLAVEFDPILVERLRTNLADRANVAVVQDDGAAWPRAPADAVYVNFGVSRPAKPWIEMLAPGGRLILPLGVPGKAQADQTWSRSTHGAGVLIERQDNGFAARSLGTAFFVSAEGVLSTAAEEHEALRAAFERGGAERVRSLIWERAPVPQRCWFTGTGWGLSYDEPDGSRSLSFDTGVAEGTGLTEGLSP